MKNRRLARLPTVCHADNFETFGTLSEIQKSIVLDNISLSSLSVAHLRKALYSTADDALGHVLRP